MEHLSRDEHKVVRDPIHGYVRIPEELVPVVQTLQIQRLRNISQTANVRVPYPSLNGSRFEHALGTMHLAMLAWSAAWGNIVPKAGSNDEPGDTRLNFMKDVYAELLLNRPKVDHYTAKFLPEANASEQEKRKARDIFFGEFPTIIRNVIGLMGLLHDVGHPPYSHLLENLYYRHASVVISPTTQQGFQEYKEGVGDGQHPQFHEFASKLILDEMITHDPGAFSKVSVYLLQRVFSSRGDSDWSSCLHGLIDSQFDVDRLDYIIRDGARAGTDFWTVDKDRLLESLEIHDLGQSDEGVSCWELGLNTRAVSAVESLLFQRMQYYRWVIFHPKALLADTCLKRAFDLLVRTWKRELDGDLSTSLDYVSNWKSPGPMGSPESFSADDSRVIELLRRRRSRTANDIHDNDSVSFNTYLRIADESSARYSAAWKNHGEFVRALKRRALELLPDQEGPVSADDLLEAFQIRYEILQKVGLGDSNAGGVVALEHEELLEHELNRHHGVVEGVSGIWIVAERLGFSAVKGAYAKLWDRERGVKIPFQDLSPVYEALVSSHQKRPAVWVFFIPRDHRAQLPSSESVADVVLDYLFRIAKIEEGVVR
ncbi:hypothetical protein [Arthrobacter sp. efr-133-R2A-120]|uniref:hypothetical protein n=1 Tax=Arthrobacter sp. efr-133-R2A-120 TaxID=3040277 RepID=UPI00254C29D3|nr:hypothetical protein [Arthrobacter sp. efr-133-R2A-120]